MHEHYTKPNFTLSIKPIFYTSKTNIISFFHTMLNVNNETSVRKQNITSPMAQNDSWPRIVVGHLKTCYRDIILPGWSRFIVYKYKNDT